MNRTGPIGLRISVAEGVPVAVWPPIWRKPFGSELASLVDRLEPRFGGPVRPCFWHLLRVGSALPATKKNQYDKECA